MHCTPPLISTFHSLIIAVQEGGPDVLHSLSGGGGWVHKQVTGQVFVTVQVGTDQIDKGCHSSLPVQDLRAGELSLNNCIIFNSFIEVKSFHIIHCKFSSLLLLHKAHVK